MRYGSDTLWDLCNRFMQIPVLSNTWVIVLLCGISCYNGLRHKSTNYIWFSSNWYYMAHDNIMVCLSNIVGNNHTLCFYILYCNMDISWQGVLYYKMFSGALIAAYKLPPCWVLERYHSRNTVTVRFGRKICHLELGHFCMEPCEPDCKWIL